ncbi:hypothetical protein ACG74X_13625 [Marivita sp. S0852]|uniref:hypothetical protein n=1 Tax=Marivita sp. S0852 TaxID=3373893 RepID=UPI003981D381
MRRIIITCVCATFPFAAVAESQLDRLENISEQMNAAMFEAMVRMAEKEGANPAPLRAAIPDGAWDDSFRKAGACLLDKYNAAAGKDEINKMLDAMDAAIPQMADMDLDSSGDEFDFLPDGMTDDLAIQINSECGLTQLSLDRMEASGFTAALMQSMAGN